VPTRKKLTKHINSYKSMTTTKTLFQTLSRLLQRVCLVALMAQWAAVGAVVWTTDHNNFGYTVSNSDLLQFPGTGFDTNNLVVNWGESWGGNTVSNLNDGTFAIPGGAGFAIASGVLVYNLDTTTNTNGYDISAIKTYGGWPNWARSQQQYDVAYATVDDPNTFVDIATGIDSGYYIPDSPSYTAVFIQDDFEPWLARRVKSVRFTFPYQLNGGAGYRELDVLGQINTGTVAVGPSIITQPQSAALPVGANVFFTVVATGTEPLSYQWFKNGTPLTGETASSLILASISYAEAGSYTVRVTNAVDVALSSQALLSVANIATNHGTTAYTVSSSDLLQSPGVAVNSSQLSINAPESGSFGVLSLTDGIFPTDGNALAIASGVLTYTLDTTVFTDGYVVTNVSTYGGWANWGRSQQAYKVSYSTVADAANFIDIVAAQTDYYFDDNPSYTFISIYNANSGVIATNVKAVRFTFPSQLNGGAGYREMDVLGHPIVNTTPEIAQIVVQPKDTFAVAGAQTTLSVTASGYPLPTYQWKFNGANMAGKTGASLVIPSASSGDVGLYSVGVSNSLGGVLSREASLTVIDVVSGSGTTEYTVSSSDLLQSSLASANTDSLIVSPESGDYTLSSLTDGIFNTDTNVNRAFSVSGGDLIYYLETTGNFRGYSVSNVNVYGGWPNPGRDAQNYILSYSTVSAPATFIDIATVSYNPPGSAPSYAAVQISGLGGGVLCNQVGAIRLRFTSQENGAAGYREVDVLGAAIPVPRITLIQKDGSGAVLGLQGNANQSYTVFRALELGGTWTSITNKTLGAGGTATVLDASAPAGAAYYRLFGP
jgi:hypothetical protein